MTIIYAVIGLGILIFIHELGHFCMAKLAGVGVKTFSLGFGARVAGFKRGMTDYRLSVFPLGGYVRMVGENPTEEVAPEEEHQSFAHKPLGWRVAIVLAGPLSNIAFALVLYYVILLGWGITSLAPRVGEVMADQPAAEAGIQKGDLIKSVNGQPILAWDELRDKVMASGGEPVKLVLERDGKLVGLTLKPQRVMAKNLFGEDEEVYRIGLVAAQEIFTREIGAGEALGRAFQETYHAVEVVVMTVVKLVQRRVPMESMGGPIMIAEVAGQAADQGLSAFLFVVALISVNLGVLNLLPIPVLDGGHLVFFALEAVRKKPVSLKVRERASQVGMFLLLMIMAVVFYNDIYRLVTG